MTFFEAASTPVTRAPSRAIGSLRSPPPQPISSSDRSFSGAPDRVTVEVECASLDEVAAALDAGVPRILLDNMAPVELRGAVELVAGRAELEASGGITLNTIRTVAETGVDYISVGALTHSAPALDVSLMLHALNS